MPKFTFKKYTEVADACNYIYEYLILDIDYKNMFLEEDG